MIRGLKAWLWAGATLLAAAVIAYILIVTAQGQAVPPLEKSLYDDQIEALDRAAVEAAYHAQIMHLYQQWMKDSTGQPSRATTGARIARKAYIDAMNGIARR